MESVQINEIRNDEWNLYLKSNKIKRLIQDYYSPHK